MTRKQTPSSKPTVDPELVRQLDQASAEDQVQAVFTLKTPAGQPYLDAQATRDTVDRIVAEASGAAKAQPHRLNVFANAQSFALSAPPTLVRSILGHGDIAGAMANVQREDMLIRPIESKGESKVESKADSKSESKPESRRDAKGVSKRDTKKR